jgi:predicted acetyltransferase
MEIKLTPITRTDTPTLRHLYELYCHDFSEYTRADVLDTGMYTDDNFCREHWRNPNWWGYLVCVDGCLAGFVWVLKGTLLTPADAEARPLRDAGLIEGEHWMIEEFFVMRKYRRQRVGETVAQRVFDQFKGVWEVSEMMENTPAQAFWRAIIARYTGGSFVEVTLNSEMWHGPVQVFRGKAT